MNNLNSKKKRVLLPKYDVVFQAVFGEVGCERITKKFLQSILKEKIETIDLSKNTILRKRYHDDKLGILDIIAKLNNKEMCNIEMQMVERNAVIERILFYWGRIYTKQIKQGEDYEKLQKTIVILIVDYNMKEVENLEYHTKWKIIEEKERKTILTDKLEIHIISLEKMRKMNLESEQDELLDWLYFLENPESERVKEKMKENEELKEAVEKVEEMISDEDMERLLDLMEKKRLDDLTEQHARERKIEEAIQKGLSQGLQQGLQQGLEQGLEQGLTEGLEKGEKTAKQKIAEKMLKENIPLEIIIKVTGLKKEEILKSN